MSEKRGGLGRGLGALIPPPPPARPAGGKPERPVDVFFAERQDGEGEAPTDIAPPITARSSITTKPDGAGAAPDSEANGTAAQTAVSAPSNAPAVDGTGPATAVPAQPAPAGPELVPVPGAYFAELPVDSIIANRKQPRQVFDEEALAEL